MEFEIPVTLTNDLEKRIAEVFSIFDHTGNRVVDHRDIGIILRVLGCCPTQKHIHDIIIATQFAEYEGNINLTKFLAHVCPMLIQGMMKPASPKDLLKCFTFLDVDGQGYLEKNYFVNLMRNKGENFTDGELNEMLAIALDPVTGELSYEYYIKQLMYFPKDSIFDIATKVEKERILTVTPAKKPTFDLLK